MSNDDWENFDPSFATRRYLRWAAELGAETLIDAYEMLEQFALSNDVPEILAEDDRLEDVRDELASVLTELDPETHLGPSF